MELSKASSSRSSCAEPEPTAKDQLHRLVDLLSDYECAYLRSAVRDVVAGERFWEGDSGLLYHEYVKQRFFRVGRNAPRTTSATDRHAFVPMCITKSYAANEQISLPQPPALTGLLQDALLHRRSRRDYQDSAIGLAQLSALLHYGCGITASVPAYGFDSLPLRTFPSHGGLQSPEVYVAARAVKGLEAGIFHYEPRSHSLELLQRGDYGTELRALAFGEAYVAQAAVVFLVTAVYDRLRWKYGERAYRFACTDVGFLGENLYLVAEDLGLGACAVSGFAQDAAEQIIDVDGKQELVLLLLTVGVLEDRPSALYGSTIPTTEV
jgi:SagB-type dehydrogenase family enzyme